MKMNKAKSQPKNSNPGTLIPPFFSLRHREQGAAMAIALLMTMLFSTLLVAALLTTRSQSPLSKYHTSSIQAYYLAEKGVQKAALWFAQNFTADPSQTNRFVLPMRKIASTDDATQYLSYVDPQGTATAYDYNTPPTLVTSFDARPTSVKITDVSGRVRNLVLSANATENTYPASYPVEYGSTGSRTISTVVTAFARDLGNSQQEAEGNWNVKAMLVALNPPDDKSNGVIVWQVTATGRTPDGAEKTITAELRASAIPYEQTISNTDPSRKLPNGILSRGALRIDKGVEVDSYRSDLGAYNANLTASSFTGQVGNKNLGANGDLHSNGFGKKGVILIRGAEVSGDAEIVTSYTGTSNDKKDPIREEKKGDLTGQKTYSAPWIDFYDVAPIPTPSTGSADYKTAKNSIAALPAGNYKKVDVDDKSTLTIPGGTYEEIRAHKDSTIILGTPGVTTKYNLQKMKIDDNVKVIINGPVIFNIQNSFKFKGDMEISSLLQPSDIHVNVQDDKGKKDDEDVENDDDDGDGVDDSVFVDDGDTKGGKVKIEKGRFYGVLYAPGSKVQIKSKAEFFGSVVGYQVKIKKDVKLHVDEAPNGWVPDPTDNTTISIVKGFSAAAFSLQYM